MNSQRESIEICATVSEKRNLKFTLKKAVLTVSGCIFHFNNVESSSYLMRFS